MSTYLVVYLGCARAETTFHATGMCLGLTIVVKTHHCRNHLWNLVIHSSTLTGGRSKQSSAELVTFTSIIHRRGTAGRKTARAVGVTSTSSNMVLAGSSNDFLPMFTSPHEAHRQNLPSHWPMLEDRSRKRMESLRKWKATTRRRSRRCLV